MADTRDNRIESDPVGALTEHLMASGAVGTFEDRLAYSLDRCGLALITEQRLAKLVNNQRPA